MVTHYRVDSPKFEPWWWDNFPHPPSLLYYHYHISFPSKKQLKHSIDHSFLLVLRLKEE
jgi:hypothetical protein